MDEVVDSLDSADLSDWKVFKRAYVRVIKVSEAARDTLRSQGAPLDHLIWRVWTLHPDGKITFEERPGARQTKVNLIDHSCNYGWSLNENTAPHQQVQGDPLVSRFESKFLPQNSGRGLFR